MSMVKYIGTKILQAIPMTRGAYNDYRGWTPPEGEDQTSEGFLVEYLDGGTPNDSRHSGYISWSPKTQFESAYNPLYTGMTFGHALVALEGGERVMRTGWNGKNMFLALVHGPDKGDIDYIIRDDSTDAALDGLNCLPWIGMRTADGGFVPWLASQTDMLAKDWVVILPTSADLVDPGYDAELRDVYLTSPLDQLEQIKPLYLHGRIYGDRRQRFADGEVVNTSEVVSWNEADSVATTKTGTRYKVTLRSADSIASEQVND